MSRPAKGELAARVAKEEVRLLMADRKFRRFIWRFFGKSGMFSRSTGSTPHDTSFREGRRDLGNEVLTELRLADPGALAQILAEYPAGLPGIGTGELDPHPTGDDDDPE